MPVCRVWTPKGSGRKAQGKRAGEAKRSLRAPPWASVATVIGNAESVGQTASDVTACPTLTGLILLCSWRPQGGARQAALRYAWLACPGLSCLTPSGSTLGTQAWHDRFTPP